MSLRPDMTLAELSADEQAQRELAELILDGGVRGAMERRRVSFDSADVIASSVSRGVSRALERLTEGVA